MPQILINASNLNDHYHISSLVSSINGQLQNPSLNNSILMNREEIIKFGFGRIVIYVYKINSCNGNVHGLIRDDRKGD